MGAVQGTDLDTGAPVEQLTGVPVDIGSANAEGSSMRAAKADHVHNHGSLAGGATHAAATSAANGFETAEQAALYNAFLQDHFGDGSDGNVTVNGPLSLLRDMYYDTLTVVAGAVISMNGNAIFCKTLLDLTNAPAGAFIASSSSMTGNNAVADVGGAFKASVQGGQHYGGSNTAQAGANGGTGAGANGTASPSNGATSGASGGASGSGGAGTGGAGGPSIAPPGRVLYQSHRFWPRIVGAANPNAAGFGVLLTGGATGAAGSAGGGDGAAAKGGGGGGGAGGKPSYAIFAKTITRATATTAAACFQADGSTGGNGGNGGASVNNTGGGGGGGGSGASAIRVGYFALIGTPVTGAFRANGGQGGTGGNGVTAGGGGRGGTGGDGGYVVIDDFAAGTTVAYAGTAGSAAAAPSGTAGTTGGTGGTLSVNL